jgi:hypothetical protein
MIRLVRIRIVFQKRPIDHFHTEHCLLDDRASLQHCVHWSGCVSVVPLPSKKQLPATTSATCA